MLPYSFSVYNFVLYLWLIVGLVVLLYFGYRHCCRYMIYKLKYKNIKTSDIYQVDHIPREDFLTLVHRLLERQGYVVRKVVPDKGSVDDGIDFILHAGHQKFALVIRQINPNYRIGSKAVGVANAGAEVHKCDGGIVISNGFFTPKAEKIAKQLYITLLDRDGLLGLLSAFRSGKHLLEIKVDEEGMPEEPIQQPEEVPPIEDKHNLDDLISEMFYNTDGIEEGAPVQQAEPDKVA